MNAIETTYKGYKFRSRLEAKWACVFDQLGWQWEYEPVDLNGYIPDFVLLFPHGNLLCEVKPAMSLSELELAAPKIEESGWESDAMIVGASVINDFALLSQRYEEDGRSGWWWSPVVTFHCLNCRNKSIYHVYGHYLCQVCGAYAGDHGGDTWNPQACWAQAHNETKWKRAR